MFSKRPLAASTSLSPQNWESSKILSIFGKVALTFFGNRAFVQRLRVPFLSASLLSDRTAISNDHSITTSLSLSFHIVFLPSFLPSSSPSLPPAPPHEKAAHFLHYYPSRIAASTQLNCLLSILFGQREGERADRLQSGNLPRKAISYSASRSLS